MVTVNRTSEGRAETEGGSALTSPPCVRVLPGLFRYDGITDGFSLKRCSPHAATHYVAFRCCSWLCLRDSSSIFMTCIWSCGPPGGSCHLCEGHSHQEIHSWLLGSPCESQNSHLSVGFEESCWDRGMGGMHLLLSYCSLPKGSLEEGETHAAGSIGALPSVVLGFVGNGGRASMALRWVCGEENGMRKTCPAPKVPGVCSSRGR